MNNNRSKYNNTQVINNVNSNFYFSNRHYVRKVISQTTRFRKFFPCAIYFQFISNKTNINNFKRTKLKEVSVRLVYKDFCKRRLLMTFINEYLSMIKVAELSYVQLICVHYC